MLNAGNKDGGARASRRTKDATRSTQHDHLTLLRCSALGCFALGLLSKPMVVTLPCRVVAARLLALGANEECSIQSRRRARGLA